MMNDSKPFYFQNKYFNHNFYSGLTKFIIKIYFIVSCLIIPCSAYADTLISAVTFFPERTIFLPTPKNNFHGKINHYILNDFKTDGLNFAVGSPEDKSDYNLIFKYAVGCPDLGQSTQCRLLVLWDLFRGDNAPVTSWQAYYPLDIPMPYHYTHFKDYQIPKGMIAVISDDFIKSLNYETLKTQEFDKVYIKPDRLNDGTTLCSFDSIKQFYESAGLYVTDTAYKARFLINTQVTPLNKTTQTIPIHVKRLILDRLTGQYQIFPIKSGVEKDFLAHDSYDCNQSAGITIQAIGLFIDKAP